jgi:hypothetical protein
MEHPIVAALMESHRRSRTLSEMKDRETEQQFRARIVELLKLPVLSQVCTRENDIGRPCDDTFVTALMEAVAATDSKYGIEVNSTGEVTYSVETYSNAVTGRPYNDGERTRLSIKGGECLMRRHRFRIMQAEPGTTVIRVGHSRVGTMEVRVRED